MARNVFLSFAMEDQSLVNLFRGQAKLRSSQLEFRDYSIKEPFERAWKTNALKQIQRTSVTICLIGKDTYRSDAVDWEVRKSAEIGNHVMAVQLTSGRPRTPSAVAALGVRVLPWKIDQIVRAIKRLS